MAMKMIGWPSKLCHGKGAAREESISINNIVGGMARGIRMGGKYESMSKAGGG